MGPTSWLTAGQRALFAATGIVAVTAMAWGETAPVHKPSLQDFARPNVIPVPADNPGTPAQVALGASLFVDTRLSRDGSMACVTCHDPAKAFTEGASRGKGIAGETLKRNTPTLWDLAWAQSFFWDGRARTLEQQARGPIEHPLEMAIPLEKVVENLKSDASTLASFRAAYGDEGLSEATVLKALAAYERTLVSPKTRFDRWVEGDAQALTPFEIKGYELFIGRAGCSKCHATWRFTDEGFHDIGLPEGADRGRGEISGLAQMNNAFKTPTLRELVWTAPYMHDGSLGTLAAANDHYFGGIEVRPTNSKDLPVFTPVFTENRLQILAFLKTLSSEEPPQPISLPAEVKPVSAARPVATAEVSQRFQQFVPPAVRITKGQTLMIRNDDERAHAVSILDPRHPFSGDAQEPGQKTELTFVEAGTYQVTCAIHPGEVLTVEVADDGAQAPGAAPEHRSP